jgi:hypothetical protein
MNDLCHHGASVGCLLPAHSYISILEIVRNLDDIDWTTMNLFKQRMNESTVWMVLHNAAQNEIYSMLHSYFTLF